MAASVSKPLSVCRDVQSQLLVIDPQTGLLRAMKERRRERTTNNIGHLVAAAKALEVPIITTRQYPQGLGDLAPEIRDELGAEQQNCDKTSFSCCSAAGFEQMLRPPAERKQIQLCGLETHICILQTAASLQAWGYEVFVVSDAVCSRHKNDHRTALQRMLHGGVRLASTESVVFEWLGDSRHEQFRAIAGRFRTQ